MALQGSAVRVRLAPLGFQGFLFTVALKLQLKLYLSDCFLHLITPN